MSCLRLAGFLLAVVLLEISGEVEAAQPPAFERIELSDQFFNEGANFGDINGDGQMDIVSGPYWWEGPDYQQRHAYYPAEPADIASYSEHFFTYIHDLTGNGRPDILVIGFPGQEARWYENRGPERHDEHWPVHQVFDEVENESPAFTDITGDGQPEIVCSTDGRFGYIEVNWENPREAWRFQPISPPGATGGRFTHGLGVGDVNGDGRADLLERNGWWEQPASLDGDPEWTFHAHEFGPGGAQMFAYDVNGDGRNDVVTSLEAHSYGLAWFEQMDDEDGDITFRRHDIMTDDAEDFPHGLAISQLHAVDLVDLNGDGLKDIVTGKRWRGGRNNPGEEEPPHLVWFELVRDDDGEVEWVGHVIDDDSGVGTQVIADDITGNGRPDILVGNKRGTYLHLQR